MTEEEKKLVELIADVIEKESERCFDSSNRNGSPYAESFHTNAIILKSIAQHLLNETRHL